MWETDFYVVYVLSPMILPIFLLSCVSFFCVSPLSERHLTMSLFLYSWQKVPWKSNKTFVLAVSRPVVALVRSCSNSKRHHLAVQFESFGSNSPTKREKNMFFLWKSIIQFIQKCAQGWMKQEMDQFCNTTIDMNF